LYTHIVVVVAVVVVVACLFARFNASFAWSSIWERRGSGRWSSQL